MHLAENEPEHEESDSDDEEFQKHAQRREELLKQKAELLR